MTFSFETLKHVLNMFPKVGHLMFCLQNMKHVTSFYSVYSYNKLNVTNRPLSPMQKILGIRHGTKSVAYWKHERAVICVSAENVTQDDFFLF